MGALAAISYIISCADNTPRGILIDKTKGEVAYAKFRVTGLNQNVPFKLIRMVNYAFGPCGVKGPFITSLVKALKGIRKYSNALATCIQFALGEAPFDEPKLPKGYLDKYSIVQAPRRNVEQSMISASSSVDYEHELDDENETNSQKIERCLSPLVSNYNDNQNLTSNASTTTSTSSVATLSITFMEELVECQGKLTRRSIT